MKRKSRSKVPNSFLKKTYYMLEDETQSEIVSWSEDGKSFVIKNPTEFSEQVLPKYFKHSNLASFVRQLNMYDFHKHRSSSQQKLFYHPSFQKGRIHLLKNIRRKSSDNSVTKQTVDHSELSPILQKVYSLHKRSLNADSQIVQLEEKVAEITDENNFLMSQIWESNERLNQVESVLCMMVSYLQANSSKDFAKIKESPIPNETEFWAGDFDSDLHCLNSVFCEDLRDII